MSYQKKSIILQELEQAIRKKAQDKSRNKEQVGYFYNYAVGPYKTPSRKRKLPSEQPIRSIGLGQ